MFKEVLPEDYRGKSIVYFYRNSDTGSASVLNLTINGKITLPLLNKGYYLFVLDPGTYEFDVLFKTKVNAEGKFDFSEDKTYFVRYWADAVAVSRPFPFPMGSPQGVKSIEGIVSVPREAALEVLTKCRLIEVPEVVNGRIQSPSGIRLLD